MRNEPIPDFGIHPRVYTRSPLLILDRIHHGIIAYKQIINAHMSLAMTSSYLDDLYPEAPVCFGRTEANNGKARNRVDEAAFKLCLLGLCGTLRGEKDATFANGRQLGRAS